MEIGLNAIYAMNLSSQSIMTREIFPQMMIFCCSICIAFFVLVFVLQMCKVPCIELMEKCRDWVKCDICDESIFPKYYYKRNISADDDFLL